jgi:hypothetical protein
MTVAVCNFFRKVRLLKREFMMTKSKASPRRRAKRLLNPNIKASITDGSKIVKQALREAKG